jgi:signal peptidase I
MTSHDTDAAARDGDDLGRAHDDAEEQRLLALDEAEDVRASRSFWRELPVLVAVALVLAVLLKVFVVQAFFIPSSSMEDTLAINDRVAVSKLSYRFGDVARGDVIVFDDPAGVDDGESLVAAIVRNIGEAIGLSTPRSEFIKRIVALEGEIVEVRSGHAIVDGVPLDEPYAHIVGRGGPDHGPFVVPSGHVFVLGDNRDVSRDSRAFGPIPIDDIVGRAFAVIWPPGNIGGV